jgi:uroporphyrinogen-III synthase
VNIKNILISQSQTDKAAYDALEAKYGVKVHFKPFITIKPVSMKAFRTQKINILDYTAIIFTSKHAVDIFFQFCKELKTEMPAEMKYFCVNETTANYIQHHVQMRKRKVFVGKGNNQDLFPLLKKHNSEKYLYPCSEIRKSDIPDFMKANNVVCKELVIYETVSAELKDININDYQIIAFFSPSGVTAIKENFPDYKQNETLFAAFGATTAKAIQDTNFRVDIQAPIPQIPSMVGAIELKLKELSDPKAYKKYVKQLEYKLEQQLEEERRIKEEQEREKLLKQKQKQLKKEASKKNKKDLEIVTNIIDKPINSTKSKMSVSKSTPKNAVSNKNRQKNTIKSTKNTADKKTQKNTAVKQPSKVIDTVKNTEKNKTVKTANNNTKSTKPAEKNTQKNTTVKQPSKVIDTVKNKTVKTANNNTTSTKPAEKKTQKNTAVKQLSKVIDTVKNTQKNKTAKTVSDKNLDKNIAPKSKNTQVSTKNEKKNSAVKTNPKSSKTVNTQNTKKIVKDSKTSTSTKKTK